MDPVSESGLPWQCPFFHGYKGERAWRNQGVNAGADTRASFKVLKACSCPQSLPKGCYPSHNRVQGFDNFSKPRHSKMATSNSSQTFLNSWWLELGFAVWLGQQSFPSLSSHPRSETWVSTFVFHFRNPIA